MKKFEVTLFLDVQNDNSEFDGFRSCFACEIAVELQKFVKQASAFLLNSALEDDLIFWVASKDEILESQKVTDAEIISFVLNSEEIDSDIESDVEEKKMCFKRCYFLKINISVI